MLSPCAPTEGRGRFRRALPAAALGLWILLAWLSHAAPSGLVVLLLLILAGQWILTLAGVRRAWEFGLREWILWGIAFRLAGLFALPVLDDDSHRFLWDGRMFALTGDPYATAPAEHFADEDLPEDFGAVLDRVNYPDVPTVYGPLTQCGFLLAYLVAPASLWPLKGILLLADLALMLAVRRLACPGDAPRAVAFVAHCPLSVFETAFNAHPEALSVALLALAMVAGTGRAPWRAGILGGLAVCAKIFAGILVPFILLRQGWRAIAACAGVVLAGYGAFWLQGTSADLAGLRAMADAWEFNSSGFALVERALGPSAARPAALALFALGWGFAGLRVLRKRATASECGFFLFAWFFLWSPTFNPWYALWLLPFVAVRRGPGGIAILAFVSLSHLTRMNLGSADLDGFAHPRWVKLLECGLIAVAFLAGQPLRRRRVHGPSGSG